MRTGITPRQADLLSFIQSYSAENGFAPTYEAMAGALGLRSKSGVHRLVIGLSERGLVRHFPNRAHCVEVLSGEPRPAVTLTKSIEAALAARSQATGMSRSDIISAALVSYLGARQ